MINVSNDYKTKIYGQTRQFDARFTLNVPGFINNATYFDDRIMEVNVNEENTPLSDILPTNQMDVKLDNRDGTFNFLTYQNMPTILASRPTMFTEVGLVTADIPAQTFNTGYTGKVSGSVVENANIYKGRASNNITDVPGAFAFEPSTGVYNNVNTLGGTSYVDSNNVSGNYIKHLMTFDVVQDLERQFGVGIWGGKTLMSDKVLLAEQYIASYKCQVYGFGSSPTGNKMTMKIWSGTTSGWLGTAPSHTANTVTLLELSTSLDTNIDPATGKVHFQVWAEPSNGTVASQLTIDFIQLVMTLNPIKANEWTPFGYAFLDNWQSDFELQTVTLFGHDWFEQLINVPFAPATYSNMTLLIQAIFSTAGITNYSIDPIIGTNFTTPRTVPALTNCRALLQLIGIVTMCAVYQDRTGKVVIKPFPSLQNNGMYTTFATTNTGGQRGIWQYAGNGGNVPYTPYEEVNDDGGNRHIQLKDMYELPRVSLEKSIYKIVVNVYNTTGASINHTNTYTNGTIGGANGISFEMNNYLIYTDSEAQNVANYFFSESNYNVEYTSNWRQNPSIECGDLVLFDDGMPVGGVPGTTSNKVTRIYKQDFNYDGALSGTTEGRGGL